MAATLTIPRHDPRANIGRSLAIAGMGSLACAGQSNGMLSAILNNDLPSTGSNITWLEKALPTFDPSQAADDLYSLSLQRFGHLSGQLELASAARSDRNCLLQIKDVLSLTGQQLAAAMGVSRTALYQWIDESKNMREKYRDRLDGLRQLSNFWSGRVGTAVSRSTSVGGADRARLVKLLSAKTPHGLEDARDLLVELASLKPSLKPEHRSILDIVKEKNWKKLPDHVRQAEWASRLPSARSTPDPD